MKIANLVLAFVFISFAIVQYNDPDPWLWISLYLLVALFCGFGAYRMYYPIPLLFVTFGCAVYLGTLFPDFIKWLKDGAPTIAASMKAESLYIELIREFFGLVMCIGALTALYFQSKKQQDASILKEEN